MSVLLGPADADHFRTKVGRYNERWYTDPLDGCDIAPASDWVGPSFSTTKKASGADWSFVSLGRAAESLHRRPQAYLHRVEAGIAIPEDLETIKAQFNAANKNGLSIAAGRGTIIHWWFEDLLAGKPMRKIPKFNDLPVESGELALRYQAAVGQFFDTYQPELAVSEVVVIDRDLNGMGYGATGDAGLRIDGKLYAVDWKTRASADKHAVYPEEAAQVGGAFIGAQYCIVQGPDGNPVRAAIPAFDGALIVSVAPEGCRVYPIDVPKAIEHYHSLHAWWVARRSERDTYKRAWPPRAAKTKPAVELHESDCGVAGGLPHPATACEVPIRTAGEDAAPAANTWTTDGEFDEIAAEAAANDAVPPTMGDTPGESVYKPSKARYKGSDAERREMLRLRFEFLSDADRERFLTLCPDPSNLDLAELAMDEADPFNAVRRLTDEERAEALKRFGSGR